MKLGDIAQVAEIERQAFPPPWPATNFKRELTSNKLARYLVAYSEVGENEAVGSMAESSGSGELSPGLRLGALGSSLRRLVNRDVREADERQLVLGFIGLWFMIDEAHVSNIAVSEAYRRQGVGEHLLISAIDVALELNARFMTLEVRNSNIAAVALYKKYDFSEVGIRHGYYTDNKEDAVVMTVDGIASAPFQERLQRLRQAHARQCGIGV